MISWSLTIVLISRLGCSESQQADTENKDICNFDPDVIFFDNEELEKLRQSYRFGGDCSPVVLKTEIGDLVETDNNRFGRDIGELGVRDRQRLNSLSRQTTSQFEVKPSLTNSNFYQRIVQPKYRSNDQDTFEHNQRHLEITPPDYRRPFGNPLLTEFFEHRNNDGSFSLDEHKRRQRQEIKRPFLSESNMILLPREDFVNGIRTTRPGSSRRPFSSKPADLRPTLTPSMVGLPSDQVSTTPLPSDQATPLPGPPAWATPPSVCVQRCPNTPEYNPVCGSDRVTYNNPGRLRCEQRCGKATVELRFYGVCSESVVDKGLLNRGLN